MPIKKFALKQRYQRDKARINAIVTRGTVEEVPDELTATKISDFINELPGYSAQVLTLGL